MNPSVSPGLESKPYSVTYIENPSQEELRRLALEHTPATFLTAHGNVDKVSRNKARMAKYTYVISPESDKDQYSGNVIDPARAAELIDRQRAHIEARAKLLQIDGYLGLGPRAVPVQWLYTLEGANIAGMQQILCFSRHDV